ncbi:nickel-dependent hydrogenase large subunit [Persephonella sp.]
MPKVERKILHRVEGEVQLKLVWEEGKIKDVYIQNLNFRGFEYILENRPPLDALVITPRICGICGHSHLIATVKALEDIYRKNGYKLDISYKASLIRNVTHAVEIIQNHIKWFYLFVMPDFLKLERNKDSLNEYVPLQGTKWKKSLNVSNEILKIISILAGQWPHTSYTLPGGVMCDPLDTDIIEAVSYVDKILRFFEEEIIGTDINKYLSVENFDQFMDEITTGDLRKFVDMTIKNGLDREGRAYNRFITVDAIVPCVREGVIKKRNCKFDPSKIREIDSYSFLTKDGTNFSRKRYSWAKAVRYDGLPMETGPLARKAVSRNKLFRDLIMRFGDSYLVRVWARIDEIGRMSLTLKSYLLGIKIKEPSYIKPPIKIEKLEGKGTGLIEAARGSLLHTIEVKNGKIKSYSIITPTTWNLGPRCEKYHSPAEKAIIGLDNSLKAEMVLRSFDVCSVCTTH